MPDDAALFTAVLTLPSTSSSLYSVTSTVTPVVIDTEDDASNSPRRVRRVRSVQTWSMKSLADALTESASALLMTAISSVPYDAHVIGAKTNVSSIVRCTPVGPGVGMVLGELVVGVGVGTEVGPRVGMELGELVGGTDGTGIGPGVGMELGKLVGGTDGTSVGPGVGMELGELVGGTDGTGVGAGDGSTEMDGTGVGTTLGSRVQHPQLLYPHPSK